MRQIAVKSARRRQCAAVWQRCEICMELYFWESHSGLVHQDVEDNHHAMKEGGG